MHEWILRGACKGKYNLFFPARYESAAARRHREAEAKRQCAACPVTEECRRLGAECERLDLVDEEYISNGIWGGLTRSELIEWAGSMRR
jgi:WhiB family redox-sensing transcriptional regulator